MHSSLVNSVDKTMKQASSRYAYTEEYKGNRVGLQVLNCQVKNLNVFLRPFPKGLSGIGSELGRSVIREILSRDKPYGI